jgi:plastocyanin
MTSLPVRATVFSCVLLLATTACSKSTTPSAAGSSPSTGQSPSASATPSTLTIGGKTANFKGTEDLAGKSTFTLELDNDKGLFYFEPTVLTGTPGQKITLILKNVGATKHNFTLEAEHINEDVNTPGTSAKVTITFPQSGTLQFHCEYHENLGMIGELQVSS